MSDSIKKAYKEGRKQSVFETISDDSIKKIREGASKWSKENTSGIKNPMWGKGKKISVEGKIYNTIREASEYLGVHNKTIQYRLNSNNFVNYSRL